MEMDHDFFQRRSLQYYRHSLVMLKRPWQFEHREGSTGSKPEGMRSGVTAFVKDALGEGVGNR